MDKKTLIILFTVIAISLGIYFMTRKKQEATTEEKKQKGVSSSVLSAATEAATAVQLSEEDEEYNRLRIEYANRYGEAPKSTWSKSMIIQYIDEYDKRDALLDLYIKETSNEDISEVATMTADDIERQIELEKQKDQKELEAAQKAYKEATGNSCPGDLLTATKVYAKMAEELIDAKKEYHNFAGVDAPENLTTALMVSKALKELKQQKCEEWNARKSYILSKAALVADKLKNRGIVAVKREIEAALTEICQYNERDFYVWYESCYAQVKNENRDFNAEFKHLNTSVLFWDSLQQLAGSVMLRRSSNYRHLTIDEYGRIIS